MTGDWIVAKRWPLPNTGRDMHESRFSLPPAIKTLIAASAPILLEVGPGSTLPSLALQTARDRAGRIYRSLPDVSAPSADEETILSALGKLWVGGVRQSGLELRTVRVGVSRCQPIRSNAGGTGSKRLSRNDRERCAGFFVSCAANAPNSSGAARSRANRLRPGWIRARGSDGIREAIVDILQDVSGETVDPAPTATFLEMGFDSLLLSQVAQRIQSRLKVKIAFRQLLGDLSTIPALERSFGTEGPRAVSACRRRRSAPVMGRCLPRGVAPERGWPFRSGRNGGVAEMMRAQVEAMSKLIQSQLDTLKRHRAVRRRSRRPWKGRRGGRPGTPGAPATDAAPAHVRGGAAAFAVPGLSAGATGADGESLAPAQRRHIDALTARLTAKTAGSKR